MSAYGHPGMPPYGFPMHPGMPGYPMPPWFGPPSSHASPAPPAAKEEKTDPKKDVELEGIKELLKKREEALAAREEAIRNLSSSAGLLGIPQECQIDHQSARESR